VLLEQAQGRKDMENRRSFLTRAGLAGLGGVAVTTSRPLQAGPGTGGRPEFRIGCYPDLGGGRALEVVAPDGTYLGPVPASFIASQQLKAERVLSCGRDGVLLESPVRSRTEALSRLNPGAVLEGVPLPLASMALTPYASAASLPGGVPSFDVGIRVVYLPPEVRPDADILWEWIGTVGQHFIRVSVEKHFIGGCIRRDVWHAGLLIRDLTMNQMIFDAHIASWWEGWRPCIALYESASGWCSSTCDHAIFDVVWALIYAALLVRLAASVAALLASGAAGAVVGALTVIPGVPPPP
jgi:hypothetical protein